MKTLFIVICIFCATLVTLVYGETTPVTTGGTHNSDCLLLTKPGPCRGYYPRYSFRSGTCKVFIYGGCAGNANNFLDIDECLKACMPA